MSYNKETGMYEGYIYCITNKVNGKKYIGQTNRDIDSRWKDHIRKARYNKDNQYLYTAMNKYGVENFDIKEIKKIYSNDKSTLASELNNKEIFYISNFMTRKPNGYNMTDGGVLLPNTYELKPVCNYDLSRNLVPEFESLSEAARFYNISEADISNCCNRKKVLIVNNFLWRFKGDDYDVKTIELHTKIICQYDVHGNFIKKYEGLNKAINEVGNANIGLCCKGKHKIASCFVWRYLGDSFDKYETPEPFDIVMYSFNILNRLLIL